MKFEDLRIKNQLVNGVYDLGFESPTLVQEKSIPFLLEGIDVVVQAQTGTGKTAAFAIGILNSLGSDVKHVHAIILTPTRELALQVQQELDSIGKHVHHKSVAIYGGVSFDRQVHELRAGANIVIGTPGRVLDHLNQGTLNLSKVKMFILDECDRMLDMGFVADVKEILSKVPERRQLCFFSATLPDEVLRLAKKFSSAPEIIFTTPEKITVDNIAQEYTMVDPKEKLSLLLSLIAQRKPKLTLIFVKTQKGVEKLGYDLRNNGLNAVMISGRLSQRQREDSLLKFKRGIVPILVATDVASRGLDVDDIDLVINYNFPDQPETYVHRIGRTGRAGKTGSALTFLSNILELKELQHIVKQTHSKITEIKISLNEAYTYKNLVIKRPERFSGVERHSGHGGFGGGRGGGGHGGFGSRRPFRSHDYDRGSRSSEGGSERSYDRGSDRDSHGSHGRRSFSSQGPTRRGGFRRNFSSE